ncbi:membrane-bound metal-dependent hydrolase [Magnetococcus marinus MC-1]|uniref:Membrane-bound metal-dependent hydrolase n=1 Tax=Magnetococcus marinus (strain ATCC BAA-1437 / JCM 17883 / MC-1) TaxID=156889 RepID=A0L9K8_MAGMM|nr:metal-dependent hydrolase [Magnetococcus marinus]ABK44651.1 membrane-bound metal-dependent hydrolase [Magnetococcus marinus MC-1]
MAGFHTHLTVGSVASGMVATGLYAGGVATPLEVALYFSCGAVASLLPDVDSDRSTILSVVFTLVSVLLAFGLLFGQPVTQGLSGLELFLLWVGLFVAMRLAVFELFTRVTVHRGIFHSIPAAILFGALTVLLLHHAFHLSVLTAWVAGGFIAGGFVLHLLLDEMYSIQLTGARVKRSFGTACKLWSRDLYATLALYATTAVALWLTPRTELLWEGRVYQLAWYSVWNSWMP